MIIIAVLLGNNIMSCCKANGQQNNIKQFPNITCMYQSHLKKKKKNIVKTPKCPPHFLISLLCPIAPMIIMTPHGSIYFFSF